MTGDPPKLVCFDWGGVILRICRGFDEARARAGFDARPIAGEPELQARRHAIVHKYETGKIECDEFFGSISDAIDGAYSPDEFRTIHDAWLIEEFSGAASVIDDLHERAVETAMLSNTNHRHWARHAQTEHGPAFPIAAGLRHPHASHLLGHAKPEPEVFASFESATGFSSHEILFFDDLLGNVEAARAAGWRAERIDHDADPPAQMRGILESLGLIGS